MKRAPAVLGLLAGLFGLCSTASRAAEQDFVTIQRGRYLATVGDCISCHTAPGGIPFAGGRPLETPFGTLVTPNLTPDPATGLGNWTDAEFLRAMREGIGRGGKRLYPALPYSYYTKATRDDLLAIKAYLATLNPVSNPVQVNQLPFPFSIRFSMWGWNMLFFTQGEFRATAAKSAEWNRGAYLVEGLGHCGACHTPRNSLGGENTTAAFSGGTLIGWHAPSLGSDLRTGIGGWSAEEIVEYLKTGRNQRSAASGPMAEVVYFSTQHMTDADLKAIATYLKDLPAVTPAVSAAPALPETDPVMVAGKAIYLDNCSACHVSSGAGVARMFPALRGNAVVQAPDGSTLVRVISQGVRAASTATAPTAPAMPPFDWKLNDEQIAAVLTYIRNAWGNAAPAVSPSVVSSLKRNLSPDGATP